MKKYIILLSLVLLASAGLGTYAYSHTGPSLIPTVNAAAVDYFLKIDGIDGESMDSRHPNAIEISSFSWGATNTGSTGGGGGAGKVNFQDMHFTSHVSKASPQLMQAVTTGEHFKKVELMVRKSGDQSQEFYKVTLENVMVTSYQSSGTAGDIPTDEFSINFSKIEFKYLPQNADGTVSSPVIATYDLKKGTK